MDTRASLRETAAKIARIDSERRQLVTQRDGLIVQAWRQDYTLECIAHDAGLSRGRVSQMMDPRPRGRPRRRQEPT